MREKSENTILRLTKVLFLSGVAGVTIIKVYQIFTGFSGIEVSERLPWSLLVYGTSCAFFVSLLVLLPFGIYIFSHRSETKEGIPMPWYAPFGILVGFVDNRWLVPRFISTPLILLLSILGGLMTYVLVMAFIFGYLLK